MQEIKTFIAVLLCGALMTSCADKEKSSSSSETESSASSVSETTEAAEPVKIPDIDEIPEGAAFEYDEENRLILTRTILKNSKTEIISEYEDYT